MGKLLRIEVEDFKSYKGRHSIGPFEQFTCVIGPNGAGKSNLMDAISFVLAIPTKYLRSQNLKELIYMNNERSDNPSTCIVSLFYEVDSVDHIRNDSLQIDQVIEFSRRVNSNGSSQFKINGNQVTQDDYIKRLAQLNILVNCRNFLIYQGDVQNIATRTPEELTDLFEQISGSTEFIPEYEASKQRKDKLKGEGDTFAKQKYLIKNEKSKVLQQKKEAEEYKKKEKELNELRIDYYLWQLYMIQHLISENEKKMSEKSDLLDEYGETERKLKKEKEKIQKIIAGFNTEKRKEEGRIQKMEKEYNEVNRKRVGLETKRKSYEEIIAEYEGIINKRKDNIEKDENDIGSLNEEIKRLQNGLDILKENRPQTKQGIVLSNEQQAQYDSLCQQFKMDCKELLEEKGRLERSISNDDIDMNTKQELKNKYCNERDEIRRRVKQKTNSIRQVEQGLTEVKKVLEVKRKELKECESSYQRNSTLLESKRKELEVEKERMEKMESSVAFNKKSQQRMDCVNRLKSMYPQVHGCLRELFTINQNRYEVAVYSAIGNRMNAVVVDSKEVAMECVQFLKEQHVPPMDFYPLDIIKPDPKREDIRHNLPPTCRMCYDVVTPNDPAFTNAVLYAVGNTVIADSLPIACTLAFQERIGEKIVTLEGDEIGKNHAMSGGINSSRDNTINENEYQKVRRRVDDLRKVIERMNRLEKECSDLEKQIRKSGSSSSNVMSIQTEIKNCEGKERTFSNDIEEEKIVINEDNARYNKLIGDIVNVEEEMNRIKLDLKQLKEQMDRCDAMLQEKERIIFGDLFRAIGVEDRSEIENEYMKRKEEFEKREKEIMSMKELINEKIKKCNEHKSTMKKEKERKEKEKGEKEKELKKVRDSLSSIQEDIDSYEEKKEEGKKSIAKLVKSVKEKEQSIQEIDRSLKDNRTAQRVCDEEYASIRNRIEDSKNRRNAVLKSTMLEHVTLPRLSQQMEEETDRDSGRGLFSQLSLTQQSQEYQSTQEINDRDEGIVDQIDFSHLSSKKICKEEAYHKKDEEYRNMIGSLMRDIEQMKPNMLAEDKLYETNHRFDDITKKGNEKYADYEKEKAHFDEIKQKRIQRFNEAYLAITSSIDDIYKELTKSLQYPSGGQATLTCTNQECPFHGGIKYTVSPVGKQYRDIEKLSGGEKTIATLALLFAIHSYRKAPFFIMDEIDDALDNANVERVAQYLVHHTENTQFLIISHKDLLFEKSNGLIGIFHNWKEASSGTLTLDLRQYDNQANEMTSE